MLTRARPLVRLVALTLVMLALPAALARASEPLPPVTGPVDPKVQPIKGEDGIYRQAWFAETFLNLKDDLKEAQAKGKRLAIIFEQRGCIYCTKMHTEVLAQRYINEYVRATFMIVQLDMWGAREVTDFDGKTFPEKKLAERWGVMFTPTVIFLKDDAKELEGQWGPVREVTRMSLGIGAGTFYDMFTWIGARVYEKDPNFQRFHLARHELREAAGKHAGEGRGKR